MSSVFLSNVDDYLAPSQACINPLFSNDANNNNNNNNDTTSEKETKQEQQTNDNVVVTTTARRRRRRGVVRHGRDRSQVNNNNNDMQGTTPLATITRAMVTHPMVPTSPEPSSTSTSTTKKTEFSMADCLACSGCVTTAETVLVEQHSLSTLKIKCKEATTVSKICFTISPASFADLMRHLQISTTTTSSSNKEYSQWARRITTFLYQTCHASFVMDGNLPLQWSLLEAAYEFCYTYQQQQQQEQQEQQKDNDAMDIDNVNGTTRTSILEQHHQELQEPSVALSCRQSQVYIGNGQTQIQTHSPGRRQQQQQSQQSLPIITSSCPALVCLIEKSTPQAVQHLSSVKSPMAMMGTLLKYIISSSSQVQQQEHPNPKLLLSSNTSSSTSTTSTTSNTNKTHVLHIAIMPCHDKKLEASRKDLQYYDTIPDTDLVITTQELLTLIRDTILQEKKKKNNNNNKSPTSNDDDDDMTHDDDCSSSNSHHQRVTIQEIQTYLQSLPLSDMESSLQEALFQNKIDKSGAIYVSELWSCTNLENDTCMDSITSDPHDDTIPVDNTHTNDHNDDAIMDDHEEENTTTSSSSSTPTTTTTTTIPLSSWLSGSGGYADFIFKFACHTLFGVHVTNVPWKPVMSASQQRRRQERKVKSARLLAAQQEQSQKSDFHEAILYRHVDGTYSCCSSDNDNSSSSSSVPVLRFATAYGLQNIQRILQPYKSLSTSTTTTFLNSNMNQQQLDESSSSLSPYHYIEAMACPSGCINGGGQIVLPKKNHDNVVVVGNATRETPTQTRQRLLETQTVFHSVHHDQEDDSKKKKNRNDHGLGGISTNAYDTIYNKNSSSLSNNSTRTTCPSGPFGFEAQQLLHTRFHIVPAMQSTTTGVPTIRDTQW